MYRLARNFPLVLACALASGNVTLDAAEVASSPGDTPHFKHVRGIPLDSEQVVGVGYLLDVAPSGNLLVLEHQANQVWLFSSTGEFIALLDPSPCHPGFSSLPITARFDPEGGILLTNGGIPGYWFSADGSCITGLNPNFTARNSLGIGEGKEIVGMGHRDVPELCRYDSTGTARWCVEVDTERPVMTRRGKIDGVSVAGNEVAHVLPADYEIRLYRFSDGKPIRRIPVEIKGANRIERVNSPQIGMHEFGRMLIQSTRLTFVHHLDDDRILVQYQHEGRWGYQLFHREGRRLAKYEQRKGPFLAVRDGFAYDIDRPEANASGDAQNPVVRVFQYVGP